MKSNNFIVLCCSLCCIALLSSCMGIVRNHQNKESADEVRKLIKVGDDICETSDRLQKAGWYLTGPSFVDHDKTRLWAFVKVGKHHFSRVAQEVTGLGVGHGHSAYVIIKAASNGKITSVE